MKLKEVVHNYNHYDLPAELLEEEVKRVIIDPKKVKKGDVFLLLKDDEKAQFKMQEALERGAKFVLGASDYGMEKCYAIRNPRRAFAIMSKNLNHASCDRLKIIGVTGTNGKTTTTNLIYDILKGAGKRVGLIGTLGYKTDGEFIDTGFTTPDPDILHKIFRKMEKEGVEYVVMEVSAHALALEKMAGIKFSVSVLTNITQDHLDFFGSMENYERAKLKLFSLQLSRRGVVCADGVNMAKFMRNCDIPVISYGINSPSDVFAIDIKQTLEGTEFVCNCNDEVLIVNSHLTGEFNVQNTLAAISACSLVGIDVRTIQREIKYAPAVEGRFNVISEGGKRVVIDFAHTPDGLDKIIRSVRELTSGKVITVFGCGGDRDTAKRPIMGKIATNLSDFVYLTSDNPRFEDPNAIIEDIRKGVIGDNYTVEPNRALAIKMALEEASEADTVIIAGKGAERYQDIQGVKHPYDDYSEVYNFFRSKLQVIEGEKEIDFDH